MHEVASHPFGETLGQQQAVSDAPECSKPSCDVVSTLNVPEDAQTNCGIINNSDDPFDRGETQITDTAATEGDLLNIKTEQSDDDDVQVCCF